MKSTDPNEYATRYWYDRLGQLTHRQHPDAGDDYYEYDDDGYDYNHDFDDDHDFDVGGAFNGIGDDMQLSKNADNTSNSTLTVTVYGIVVSIDCNRPSYINTIWKSRICSGVISVIVI